MTTNFRGARESHATSGLVFSNTDHFGTTGVYTSAEDGSPRTVIVDFRPSAIRNQKRLESTEDDLTNRDMETMYLDVCKDETVARGGVSNPQQGDSFVLDGETEDAAWVTKGIYQETDFTWVLEMMRNRAVRIGKRTQKAT